MPQPQTPALPATPQSPGRELGESFRRVIDQAVAGALAPARAELARELEKLRIQREALQGALEATTDRSSRRELERQVDRLDRQISEAQSGLEKIDRQIANHDVARPARTTEVGTPTRFPGPPARSSDFNPAPMVISIMAILFIGFPLALTAARLLWRRATHTPPPALNIETARRFDRLEQSVDAIAIEVERISENQRYLTRLLAEPKQGAKLGS